MKCKRTAADGCQDVRDDDAGFAVNGGSKHVAIISVWQCQILYAVLETCDQGAWSMRIHQLSRPLKLRPVQVRTVVE